MRKWSIWLAVVGVFFIGWMAHGAYIGWDRYEEFNAKFTGYLDRSADIVSSLPSLMETMPPLPEPDPGAGPTEFDELMMEQRILTKEMMSSREDEVFSQLEQLRIEAEAKAAMAHELELKRIDAWTEIGKVAVPVLLTALFGFFGLRKGKD